MAEVVAAAAAAWLAVATPELLDPIETVLHSPHHFRQIRLRHHQF